MKILVANLGSTSFKYRLFDMADEKCVARGGVERIGSAESPCFVEIGGKRTFMLTLSHNGGISNHGRRILKPYNTHFITSRSQYITPYITDDTTP
jgi:acetate kinase